MSDIRDALMVGIGTALVIEPPIAAVWGVVILMEWLQKAMGL